MPSPSKGDEARPSGSRPSSCRTRALGADLLAEPLGERRAAALHRVGAEHAADQADEARGDGRVEDDRAAARLGLAGADHRRPPARPPRADRLGVERRRAAAEVEAEPGLAPPSPSASACSVGVAAGGLVLAGDPGRGGDRDALVGVGVDRLLDPGDPRVGGERRALDRERELGDLGGGPGAIEGSREPARARRLAGRLGGPGELVLVGRAAAASAARRRAPRSPASPRSVPNA